MVAQQVFKENKLSIEKTLTFFQIAKPNPTDKDVMAQFGADTEECSELFEAFGFDSENPVVLELKHVSDWAYKAHPSNVYDINKEMALDAICDKLVTAIGLARTLNMDIVGAFNEVAESNLSKFYKMGEKYWKIEAFELQDICEEIEAQGRYKGVHWKREGEYAVFLDENSKILKNPRTYFEPNLKPYLKGENNV